MQAKETLLLPADARALHMSAMTWKAVRVQG